MSERPNIVDPQDGQPGSVWTKAERGAEQQRRGTQQAAAAAAALAATEARIAEIRADGTLTAQEKLYRLRQLSASGYSDEEFRVLRAAQEEG